MLHLKEIAKRRLAVWSLSFVIAAGTLAPSYAEFQSFQPSLELNTARNFMLETRADELDANQRLIAARDAHVNAMVDYGKALAAYQKNQIAQSKRDYFFAEEQKLSEEWKERRLQFDLSEKSAQESVDAGWQNAKRARDSGLSDAQYLSEVKFNTALIEKIRRDRRELNTKSSAYHDEVQQQRDALEAFDPEAGVTVFDLQRDIERTSATHEAAFQRAERNAKKARAGLLSYYTMLEDLRPPYIKSLIVKHKNRVLYQAEWQTVPGPKKSGSVQIDALEALVKKNQTILELSQQRIAQLTENRTKLRKLAAEARVEAQRLENDIVYTKNYALFQKTLVDIGAVLADLYVSGGALTIASYGASQSTRLAISAYTRRATEQTVKNYHLKRELAESVKAFYQTYMVKGLESRIEKSLSDAGVSGAALVATSEVAEHLVKEAISIGVGDAFEKLDQYLLSKASETALRQTIAEAAERSAARIPFDAVPKSNTGATIAILAADIATKVIIASTENSTLETLGERKLSSQTLGQIATAAMNNVQLEQEKERRRALLLETKIEALQSRIQNGHPAQKLEIKSDLVLDIDELSNAHTIDIIIEVSSALDKAPQIYTNQSGVTVEPATPDLRSGPNHWKTFATLDEDQLEGVQKIDWLIKLSEGRHKPYWAFDTKPGTVPFLRDLKDRGWDNFEPGEDANYALKLEPLKCRVPTPPSVSAQNIIPGDEGSPAAQQMQNVEHKTIKSTTEQEKTAKYCPADHVGLIDPEEFISCASFASTGARLSSTWINLTDDSQFYDQHRGLALSPFTAEEVLFVCLGDDLLPTRDGQGQVQAFANFYPDKPASNGYVSPWLEEVDDILGAAMRSLNEANAENERAFEQQQDAFQKQMEQMQNDMALPLPEFGTK